MTIWTQINLVFTFVSPTQFSTPGNQTGIFVPGTQVQATVAAGTIYGTVASCVAAGSPIITYVNCAWAYGQLDSGLSNIFTAPAASTTTTGQTGKGVSVPSTGLTVTYSPAFSYVPFLMIMPIGDSPLGVNITAQTMTSFTVFFTNISGMNVSATMNWWAW